MWLVSFSRLLSLFQGWCVKNWKGGGDERGTTGVSQRSGCPTKDVCGSRESRDALHHGPITGLLCRAICQACHIHGVFGMGHVEQEQFPRGFLWPLCRPRTDSAVLDLSTCFCVSSVCSTQTEKVLATPSRVARRTRSSSWMTRHSRRGSFVAVAQQVSAGTAFFGHDHHRSEQTTRT